MNKICFVDCDGVLTNGGITYSSAGEISRVFNARDGHGFKLLREANWHLAVLTASFGYDIEQRCYDLSATYFPHTQDKLTTARTRINELFHTEKDVISAFMGDDIFDLELLKYVTYAGLPFNAHPYLFHARTVTHDFFPYVTKSRGGEGAFREFADFLLEMEGK